MSRRSGRARRRRGFSLVEVLVSLSILAIGLLAVSTMVPTAYVNIWASGRDTQALGFAQQRLDQLRALPYTNSALNAGTYTDAAPTPDYTQRYQVGEMNPPMAGIKLLTVTVTGPRGRQVQLKTLIAQ